MRMGDDMTTRFDPYPLARVCALLIGYLGMMLAGMVLAAENPVGSWRYDKGGFNDDISLKQGGSAISAKDPGNTGQWRMEGDELLVRWKNGWTNRYRIGPGLGPFSGFDVDINGVAHAGGTFTRVGAPAEPCFNTQITALGDGMTQYVISNNDCGGRKIIMPGHRYCALSWVHQGGFNSGCQITKTGRDWVLLNIDPGPPDAPAYLGESQICAAICYN